MMALIYDLRRRERCTQREESPTSRMVWATSKGRVSRVMVGGEPVERRGCGSDGVQSEVQGNLNCVFTCAVGTG